MSGTNDTLQWHETIAERFNKYSLHVHMNERNPQLPFHSLRKRVGNINRAFLQSASIVMNVEIYCNHKV